MDFHAIGDTLLAEPAWAARTRSRANGTFTLEGLPPGRWTFVATAPGFPPAVEEDRLLGGGGGAAPVEFLLRPGSPLRVRVVDGQGRPVPGAAVAVSSLSRFYLLHSHGFVAAPLRARTDAEGRCVFTGPREGDVALQVRTGPGRETEHRVNLGGPGEATVRTGGSATLRLRVKDPAGAAVAGAEAVALMEDPEGAWAALLRGVTDGEGRLILDGLPAGRVSSLVVRKGEFAPAFPLGSPDLPGEPLLLADGGGEDREVVLRPGATVRGTVARASTGKPVPGATVTLVVRALLGLGAERAAVTDASGGFQFTDLPEGPALLEAAAEGLACPGLGTRDPTGEPLPGAPPDPARLEITAATGKEARRILLEETGAVEGRVTAAGAPVAGARVELLADGPVEPVLSDGSGAFRFQGVPAALALRLSAAAPGRLTGRSAPFDLAPGGKAASVDILLPRGGTIRGRITGPGGAPVAGAKVRVGSWSFSGGSSPSAADLGRRVEAITDGAGEYVLAGLPAATATLRVEAAGFAPKGSGRVAVTEGGVAAVDMALEAARAIAGRVVDAEGRPVAGARVSVAGKGGAGTAVSGADGSFRVEGLGAGPCVVRGSRDGTPPMRGEAKAEAGDTGVEVRIAAR